MPSKEGWLRTSRYLKTRRPAPRVLLIAITNPPYNLLNGDIFYELERVLKSLSIRETGCVILTSNLQDIFISHYDVNEINDLAKLVPVGAAIAPSIIRGALWVESWLSVLNTRPLIRRSPLAGLANLNVYHEVTNLLRTIPQVTIAAINGRAFGGGCELAMACDFRIMVDTPPEGVPGVSRGSGIGQPEITLGLMPGGGGTQMLTRMFGPAKALEICLMRPLISAQEALELGLVTKLVSREHLIKETVDLAVKMSRRAPTAVAAIKDSIHNGAALSMMAGMRREQGDFAASALNPESQAAMTQYITEIDTFLGSEGGMAEFEPLVNGTFIDMIPEGVSMNKYLVQSLQGKKEAAKKAKYKKT